MITRLGCKISLDEVTVRSDKHRTREENMRDVWVAISTLYKACGAQLPTTKEEFLRRGGRVDWYRSY